MSTYKFIHLPTGAISHIWNVEKETTLCSHWSNTLYRDEYIVSAVLNTNHVCTGCEKIIEERATQQTKKRKGPKLALPRPEEEEYLKRWKGVTNTHPSFWEKMDKDPAYERTVKRKYGEVPFYYDKVPPPPPKKY